MQKHKGVLLPARARAPVSSSAVESWREPRAQIYSSIYKFRTKTGSWQGLIGCRGFLVFTDWPVIPLMGQSYHLSDWPELPSPEALEAWLRDYFWPSAPLWACHGSGEVVTVVVLSHFLDSCCLISLVSHTLACTLIPLKSVPAILSLCWVPSPYFQQSIRCFHLNVLQELWTQGDRSWIYYYFQ